MEKKKEKIVSAVATIGIIFILFGATYAYFAARVDAGKITEVEITANTVDVFSFETGDPISLSLDQETFAEGTGNKTGSTFAKATLTANNKTNTATEHYYLYVNIQSNTFTYSKDTDHPEIIMNIANEDGTEITSLDGYDYVTTTDANNEPFKGFDITNKSGVIEVFTNREITTTSTKTEKWNVTITFINYDFNQAENAGKSFKAKLMIQKEEEDFKDLTITVADLPSTYGATGSITCGSSTATYNQKYNEISISNIGKYDTCKLVYTEPTSKTYLNDYVLALAGTTQGKGQVVNETATIDNSTFTAGSILTESGYNVLTNEMSNSDTDSILTFDSSANTWTSNNHTDGTTATMTFNVTNAGHYQVCYIQPTDSAYDYTVFYKNDTFILSLMNVYTTSYKCTYLGEFSTTDIIKVIYKKNGGRQDDSDNLVFYLQSGTYNEVQTVSASTRYEGKNPNNYIWFNNELWRIIGVFDSSSHGQSNTNLVKIMRVNSIGSLVWDKSDTNDWTTSSLNSLLNGAYLNAQDGTDSGYCYTQYDNIQTNCDYRMNGIQERYRSMIQNATWYLGGSSTYSATAEEFYGYERERIVYSGNPTSTTGYIGLMYPSDYGYSVLSSDCARTTNLGSYNSSSCGGQSWIVGNGIEWLLSTSRSYSGSVFYLITNGTLYMNNYYARYGFFVRPVLYLKADVYYIEGDGSIENPIIIGE